MTPVLGRPFGDATSGLWAVNAKALPLLAEPFTTEAPEVEALIRVADAGLRLEEVPVNMADARGRRVEAPRVEGAQGRPDRRGHAARGVRAEAPPPLGHPLGMT